MRWALFLLVAAALWGAVPTATALADSPGTRTSEVSADAPGRVAFVGVPGLHWDDVDPARTPNLWRLAGQSDLGSVSVKTLGTVACPFDGWMTVSAGIRSAYGQACGLPPAPEKLGEGARVPGFAELLAKRDGGYVGTLGTAVHGAGQCTTAVGRGAALALADRDGKVDLYAENPAALTDWARCQVLAVDVDELITPYLVDGKLAKEPEAVPADARRAAVRAADAEVGAVLAKLPADTQVVLAGIGDHGSVPHLRVAMWKRAEATGAYLGTRSTRRDDIVILTDITPTVLTAAGIAIPPTIIGLPWQAGERASLEEVVAELRRSDLMGTSVRSTTGLFFTGFAITQVAFYAIAYYVLSRRRKATAVGVAALGVASIPVSTYLVNLLPWVRGDQPVALLIGGVIAIAVAIMGVAVAGPWRRSPLGPPAVVAGITGAVLVGDLLTGTTLQFNSLMGYTAVVGGRYYGLANIPFALLATAVLMTTAVAADHLVRVGRRRVAVGLVAGLGVAAMLLAGWPGIGSDFGGVIAFVPGIAVTALLVAGQRVSVVKFVGFCGLGGVAVSVIAVLDFQRPLAQQTHLGRFVGQVIEGTFLPMIFRKLGAMLNTMLSPNLMPIVIAGLAFLIFAIMRPGKISAGVVPLAFARAPMLRAGLIGALVSGVVGMLVNDSGTAVLSMVVALAVPLVLYAGINSAPEEAQVAGPLGDDAVDGAASGAANESDGHAGVVAGKA
ncbi:alkaline phosphatase family protein [Nonomuraea glycinis]|uniref:hypothetical protein n=1 Tax=Nonomuraea glycinis TaxID=2047744 RepID=UPI002E13A486|nr:hypothetical protein OHA68_33585 [Nonomuraea glycinis]